MDSIIVSEEANVAATTTSLWDALHTQALMNFHAAQTSNEAREAFAVPEKLSGRFCPNGRWAYAYNGNGLSDGNYVLAFVKEGGENAQGDDPEYTWKSMLARMRHEYKL